MDSLDDILSQFEQEKSLFPTTSRYFGIEIKIRRNINEELTLYLKRRFIPKEESVHIVKEHIVSEGERLDNLTHAYIGNPEQFWRLCDVNNILVPNTLADLPGKWVKIPSNE